MQELLRDDGYPLNAINEAIDRVLADINNSGRYRFQEGIITIALVQGTYTYVISSTSVDILGDSDAIYAAQTTSVKSLHKMDYGDALADGRFNTTATQGVPEIYSIRIDGSGATDDVSLYVDPVPSGDAAGKTITLLTYNELGPLASDLAKPFPLPARYHPTLLVYGTLAEVAPATQVRGADGFVPAAVAYERAFKSMQLQEKWSPHIAREVKRDNRWNGFSRVGMVSSAHPTSL